MTDMTPLVEAYLLIEQPRQNRGYTITRRYSKLGDDGKLTAAENLRVGDRVLVTLDITVPRRATYLAVVDPLPGYGDHVK